jgi:hypothetical protein
MAKLPVGRGRNGADQALAGDVKAICNGWGAGCIGYHQPSQEALNHGEILSRAATRLALTL